MQAESSARHTPHRTCERDRERDRARDRPRSANIEAAAGALMDAHWQRLPLLWLLAPLLWLQARHVRRVTPRMPEPPGRRTGATGSGTLVRLLVAGDSGAAGVGAPTQDQALCGQLVRRLSRYHTVEWCVMAVKGLDSPGLLKLLQDAPCERFDVVVLSMGANDATGLCAPVQWARWQTLLNAKAMPDKASAVAAMRDDKVMVRSSIQW